MYVLLAEIQAAAAAPHPMPTGLFRALHEATSDPRDPLYSVEEVDILAAFDTLGSLRSLRFAEDGSNRSRAVSRVLSVEVEQRHGFLPAQLRRIAEIF